MGMTDAKITTVLLRYEQKIEGLLRKEDWEEHAQLLHAKEMIPKMRKFLESSRREKVFRWLGFLQGIFYCNGIYSIEEMADHNRPNKAEIETANKGHSLAQHAPCSRCGDLARCGDLDGCHLWKDYAEAPMPPV